MIPSLLGNKPDNNSQTTVSWTFWHIKEYLGDSRIMHLAFVRRSSIALLNNTIRGLYDQCDGWSGVSQADMHTAGMATKH